MTVRVPGHDEDDDVLPGGFPALVGEADGEGIDGDPSLDGSDDTAATDRGEGDVEVAADRVVAPEDLLDAHAMDRRATEDDDIATADLAEDGDADVYDDLGTLRGAPGGDDVVGWDSGDDDLHEDDADDPGSDEDGEGTDEVWDGDPADDDHVQGLPERPSLDAEDALAEDLELDDVDA